jgi:hypothetical protein
LKRKSKLTRVQIERELNITRQLIAALVQRSGGYACITAAEFDDGVDDFCEINASPGGCEIRVTRKIKVVSSLN